MSTGAEVFATLPTRPGTRRCPLCGAPPAAGADRNAARRRPFTRCDRCGLRYRSDASVAEERDHWTRYGENATEQRYDALRVPYYRALWRRIRGLPGSSPEPRQVLDIGCVPGMLLHEAAGDGWETHGVEMSESLCAITRRFCGARVWEGLVEEIDFGGERFDLVTCADVFRHFSRPLRVLERCRRLLKPGGCVVIREINAAHPRHRARRLRHPYPFDMQFLDAGTARAFLRRAGFSKDACFNAPLSLLTSPPGNRIARSKPATYRRVLTAINTAARLLDPIPRVSGRPLTPCFLAAGWPGTANA